MRGHPPLLRATGAEASWSQVEMDRTDYVAPLVDSIGAAEHRRDFGLVRLFFGPPAEG